MRWRSKLFILALVYCAGFGTAAYMTDGEIVEPPEEIHESARASSNIDGSRVSSQCREIMKKVSVIAKEQSLKLNDYMVRQIDNYRQTRKTPG